MIEPFTIPVEDALPFVIVLAISPSGSLGVRLVGESADGANSAHRHRGGHQRGRARHAGQGGVWDGPGGSSPGVWVGNAMDGVAADALLSVVR